jgi:hypothetical protein
MDDMIFEDLPPITNMPDDNNSSDEEPIKHKHNEWLNKIGDTTQFKDKSDSENSEIFSEQDLNLLKTIEEKQMIVEDIPDEIFFSNKENCITYFGVSDSKSRSRSSVFIHKNVTLNPFSVYKGELYACGLAMR